MKLIAHDPRPWQICLYVILSFFVATGCLAGLMCLDTVLNQLKAKPVPLVQEIRADYVHITKSEVWMSGVTEEGKGWVK